MRLDSWLSVAIFLYPFSASAAWLISWLFLGYPWLFLLRGYFLARGYFSSSLFPSFSWLFWFAWLFFANVSIFPCFCAWLFFLNTGKADKKIDAK